MLSEKRNLHFGINFLLAPTIPMDTDHALEFQRYLSNNQIDFDRTDKTEKHLRFIAVKPDPLEVTVGAPGPQIAQLLIVAPNPTQPSESFVQQAETICQAFSNIWRVPQRQIISRDACIRHLYQSESTHAFQFVWEKRLRQNPEDLGILGRPVLGGGLRLVLPPNEQPPTQIEIKVESYLRDSRFLFVEMQYAWPFPIGLDEGLRPRELLQEIERYCAANVIPFIVGDLGNRKGGQGHG